MRACFSTRRRLILGARDPSAHRANEGAGVCRPSAGPITASTLPDAVTNRIFSVTFMFGEKQLVLEATGLEVRPLLMTAGKQVGAVGMALDAEFDRTTGCVKLEPNKPVTVAFLLSDESAASLRVVVQDPATDAELYRSPARHPGSTWSVSHEQRNGSEPRRARRQGEPPLRRQGRAQGPRAQGQGRRQRAGLRPRVPARQVLRLVGRDVASRWGCRSSTTRSPTTTSAPTSR